MRIGAPTPLIDITAHLAISTRFPALVEAANTVGSVQIRNRHADGEHMQRLAGG